MSAYEKITVLENEVEAQLLGGELDGREIPYALRSYQDSVYPGIYQLTKGWGFIEASAADRDEILAILEELRTGNS